MKKLFSLFLFMAATFSSHAQWQCICGVESIYPDEEFIFYCDALILPEGLLYNADPNTPNMPFHAMPELVNGRTYKLKVTGGTGNNITVDSCYVAYSDGTLAHPCGYYGFYNIDLQGNNPGFDIEDYPGLTDEEYEAIYALSGFHFWMDITWFTYIKVEVFENTSQGF